VTDIMTELAYGSIDGNMLCCLPRFSLMHTVGLSCEWKGDSAMTK